MVTLPPKARNLLSSSSQFRHIRLTGRTNRPIQLDCQYSIPVIQANRDHRSHQEDFTMSSTYRQCSECGTALPIGSTFCPNCVTPYSEPLAPPQYAGSSSSTP